jgi:hypothetical protein
MPMCATQADNSRQLPAMMDAFALPAPVSSTTSRVFGGA